MAKKQGKSGVSGVKQKIDWSKKEDKQVFWHSASHVLAMAVKELWPNTKLAIGPAIDEGFYYDFERKEPFTPEDLKKIEQKMYELVKKDTAFERKEVSKKQALELFKGNPYKTELINELKEAPSIYKNRDFFDLCRGPHIKSTGMIKAFKLTKIAGAYWKGDSKNKMLQRIYGIAFPEREQLKAYLKLIEEAEKRDHRKLGKQMDLFSFHDEGPGFPFFHNKGMIIWNELMEFWRQEHKKAGYQEIKTPIILSRNLWEQSGHWDHYKKNMYFTKIEDKDYAVKPMNCPGGILVYKEKIHSYKELPIRSAEVGLVHRHELSGVLSGLFRVRAFTQDDAHIFMMESQIKDEIIGVINLIDKFYKVFGLSYHCELSTMPKKHIGDIKTWQVAEKALESALKSIGKDYKINPGDGAFYGPKIDFHIKDALGRTWQCATIQLDFAMPEKFDLTYEGKDGKKHRPVMIHRVVYGAIERFFGILTEHFAGKFPLWLAPTQVKVLTVADRFSGYAHTVAKELEHYNIRVEIDDRQESVGYKVRQAQNEKVPIIVNVGEKEEKNKTVAIRTLDGKVSFGVSIDKLTEKINSNIRKRELTFSF